MHAFDYPNYYGYRFSFCICFVLISLSAYTLEKKADGIPQNAYTMYTVSLIILYSIMIPLCERRYSADQTGNSYTMFVVNTLFLSAYLVIFIATHKTTGHHMEKLVLRTLFPILFICELVTNIYVTGNNRGNAYEAALDNWITEGQTIKNIQANDSSFYRISVENDINANAPAWFNYAGLNTFSSSDEYNLRYSLHNLGVAAPNREIYDIGYTPVTYALTGTKYHILKEAQENDSNISARISTESDAYLPLLFMCSRNISDYSAKKDPFINQENLISSLYGKDCHFFTPITYDDVLTGGYNSEMAISSDQICFIRKSTLSNDAYYTFAVPHDESRIFYACFYQEQSMENKPSTKILCATNGSGTPVQPAMGSIVEGCTLSQESNQYILDASPDLIYDGICNFSDNPGITSDKCQSILFYEYKKKNSLKEICDDLSSTAPTITSFRSSDIKAAVHVTDDRPILFTTIPYDEGWSIYCDGEKIETIANVENAFLGARLPEGDHEIELKYTARFAKEGLIISLIGAAILSVIIIISLLQRREHADSPKDIAP